MNNKTCLIKPASGEGAYRIAACIFNSLWEKVTGNTMTIMTDADKIPTDQNVVILGSDAVNCQARKMIEENVIDMFCIRYGSDDYQLLSAKNGNRNILFVLGGCGRSTIYAVYDFFQRRAGVRYFWDGDRIPQLPKIDLSELNVIEKPRFEYRGLRYFAHRGLHRFQAEHWDFDDWKREIDWILKKRLNMFMLRIGVDDLFQRAFPDIVKYPPEDKVDPEVDLHSYNDRTCFWGLRQRGILREKVLRYAFERELMHPEDCGTMTHWYSSTPKALLEHENITFTDEDKEDKRNGNKNFPNLVWDVNDPKTWERYWKLTETHIREFGAGRLFHTIGLAERTYPDAEKNLKLKIWVLSKINQMVREYYPDAPLLIASWDFMLTWKPHEVREAIKMLDPNKTIILDYTADIYDYQHENNFTNWELIGKFPWFFGIFQELEPHNDLRGDFALIGDRLKLAVNDPKCKGMVYWSEFSHGDSFMLEYFAANSWSGNHINLSERIKNFCYDRYPDKSFSIMYKVWETTLEISQTRTWTSYQITPQVNSLIFFHILGTPWLTKIDNSILEKIEGYRSNIKDVLNAAPRLFALLPDLVSQNYDDKFLLRDIVDIARITLSRVLHSLFLQLSLKLEQWRSTGKFKNKIEQQIDLCEECLKLLGQVLSQHNDFSLYDSLLKLETAYPVNPHSEQTLKGNTNNGYCRSFYAEFFPMIYLPEFGVYKKWIKNKLQSNDHSPWIIKEDDYKSQQEEIQNNYYQTPLKDVHQLSISKKHLQDVLLRINAIMNKIKTCRYSSYEI